MTDDNVADKGPVGLGGWLILPILGLFGSIIFTGKSILEILPVIQDLQAAEPGTLPAGLLEFIWIEVAANAVIILAVLWTLFLLFQRSRLFPKVYIFFMAFSAVVVIGDSLVAIYMFDVDAGPTVVRDLVRSVVGCAIWIPYMLVSVRVRNTFVN